MPVLVTFLYINFAVILGYVMRAELITFDPGIGWHIKTGEYLFKNGAIPYMDPFLSVSKPWIADQWLMDGVLYLIHSLGPWYLTASLVPVVFTIIFFGFLYNLIRNETNSHVFSLLVCTLVFFVAQIQFLARPLVFSFLFFILCYGFVLGCYQANCNALTKKRVAFVTLLFIAWANIHPSFILGFLIFISAIGACVFAKSSALKPENWVVFLLISSVSTLANPFFFELHLSVLDLGASKYFMSFHREWQPYAYEGAHGIIVVALLTGALAEIFYSRKLLSQKTLFFLISTLGFLHLGLGGVRMITYFAIAASVPATLALCRLPFSSIPVLRTLTIMDKHPFKASVNYPAIIFLCLLFPLSALVTKELPLIGLSALPDKERYPYQELEWINEQASKTSKKVILLTTSDFGGFISYFSRENVFPVIDDRNTLVGEAFYRRFIEGLSNPETILELSSETESDFLLLDNDLASTKLIHALKLAPVCIKTETNTLFLTSTDWNCPLEEGAASSNPQSSLEIL